MASASLILTPPACSDTRVHFMGQGWGMRGERERMKELTLFESNVPLNTAVGQMPGAKEEGRMWSMFGANV